MEKSHNRHLLNIVDLEHVAQRDGWVVEYDADTDNLYWTRPTISSDARLARLSDEFALYLTPAGEVQGVFIEYARHNFVEHHTDFKPIFDRLTQVQEDRYVLKEEDAARLTGLLGLMANKVSSDTAANLIKKNIPLEQVFA